MSTVMIQIRNVPKDIHRTLKIRAAGADMSLSEYLLAELKRLAERPTQQELFERMARRQPASRISSAAVVKFIREARDAGEGR